MDVESAARVAVKLTDQAVLTGGSPQSAANGAGGRHTAAAVPKLIAFDLDGTLWCAPPFTRGLAAYVVWQPLDGKLQHGMQWWP